MVEMENKNMETKRIKIIKATSIHGNVEPWYTNKIGEVYEVYTEIFDMLGKDCYNLNKEKHTAGLYVKVEDCEDVI